MKSGRINLPNFINWDVHMMYYEKKEKDRDRDRNIERETDRQKMLY